MRNLIDYIRESKISFKNQNYTIITYYPKDNDEDYEFLKTNKNSIFTFLDDGYKYVNLGNFRGCQNERSLVRNCSCLRIGFFNNEMIAISIYTNYQYGNKAVGYTVTTSKEYRDLGILALKDIIKLDINSKSEYFWTICSGAIQHIWEKNGGTKIPNLFVEDYLGNNRKYESLNDGYLFKLFDKNDDWSEKIIFGYNSKETYNKISKYLEDYVFNNIDNKIKESFNDKTYSEDLSNKLASFIDLIDFEGITEMPQKCIDYFKTLIEEVEKLLEYYTDNKQLINNYESCKESLEYLKPLEMHKKSF